MEKTLCGADCTRCPSRPACQGCAASSGRPFGKPCFVARYISLGGQTAYRQFVQTLLGEINALPLPGLPKIDALVPLAGRFVNLEYTLPNGQQTKLLDDREIYLGTQAPAFGDADARRCFGIVAAPQFLLVSAYGPEGRDPELILYKKR